MPVPEYFFWIAFAAFAAYALYRFVKHGGFRGMLYGSAIARTVGEIELESRRGITTTFRVHVLENGNIILEQSSRSLVKASLNGTHLSVAEADRLISLLQQARS